MIVAGLEIRSNDNIELFEKLITTSKMYYSTTVCSKSIISENNEYFVGVYAGKSSDSKTLEILTNSDLIIFVGVHITEFEKIDCSISHIYNKNQNYIFIYGGGATIKIIAFLMFQLKIFY